MGERGTPVTTWDDDAHAPIAKHSGTANIARAFMRTPVPASDAGYFGGGVPAAGGFEGAGATSALVVLLVNRQPSLVLIKLSV